MLKSHSTRSYVKFRKVARCSELLARGDGSGDCRSMVGGLKRPLARIGRQSQSWAEQLKSNDWAAQIDRLAKNVT